MSSPLTVTVLPPSRVRGRVRPPGDKSISHRYGLLSALADGTSSIHGYSTGGDCRSTLDCLRARGASVEEVARPPEGLSLRIAGRGLGGLRQPSTPLDAGNSGSTMRMLAGVLAAHPFRATMIGDDSLSRRPMRRVIVPLERMGARVASNDGRPPLTIDGLASPVPIDFQPEVPSAQVKSAVLLAGLHSDGVTRVRESTATRDHTERALAAFGVEVHQDAQGIGIQGGQRLTARQLAVPGDISSAAFSVVAAASLSGSEIVIDGVGLNPSRTGIIDILRRMGAQVSIEDRTQGPGEPVGTITVRYGGRGATETAPREVPGGIDELPVLGALATHGGELHVTGAGELRVKESDRISALADGFRRMGGEIEEFPDGFHISGRGRLKGGEVDARHDHRLAMAFAIAALGASGPTV